MHSLQLGVPSGTLKICHTLTFTSFVRGITMMRTLKSAFFFFFSCEGKIAGGHNNNGIGFEMF